MVALVSRAAALAPPGSSRDAFAYPDSVLTFGPLETARCLECHAVPQLYVVDPTLGAWRDRSVDAAAWSASAHAGLACTQCHDDVIAYPHVFQPARRRVDCADACHATAPDGSRIQHTRARADVLAGAHARGFADDEPGGPGCVTCHGAGDAHAIVRRPGARPARVRLLDCAPCHDDAARMRDAGVDPDAVASYRGSFHSKALRLGSERAPACGDCHGHHAVRAAADTASTVHPSRLVQTCGREACHAGAIPAFAISGANHLERRVATDATLAGTRRTVRFAGSAVAVALVLGVALEARRRAQRVPRPPEPGDDALVSRLSVPQRLQHGALVLAFVTLAATGLPVRFPDASLLAAWHSMIGGPLLARALHRGAAVVMIAVLLAHVGYALALLVRQRGAVHRAWPLLPTADDVREFGATLSWTLHRRTEPPDHDRHHFRSKIHYAAATWGVLVMVASGLVLWFPVFFSAWLPTNAIGLAQVLHGDEAVLAVLVVLVWHLWLVHVRPGRHHRFLTWLDGRITVGQWRDEHGREAARVPAPEPTTDRDALARAQPALLAIVLIAALFLRAREAVRTPLWYDELFTLWMARHSLTETLRLLPGDIHPPLPTMLVSLWWAIAGDHPFWLRTLPIAVGLLTVIAAWGLGRALFGARAGLLAAALLALHPSHVYFSQELRGYGLLGLSFALSAWGAWRWREAGRARHAALWVAGATIGVHTHYLAVLALVVIELAVLPAVLRGRRFGDWLRVHAVMAVLAAPLLAFVPAQLALSRDNWIPHPPFAALADLARRIAFEAWYALPAVGVLAALAWRRPEFRRAATYAAWLGVAPIVASFAITHVGPHLFAERYMYFTLPCWCALFAAGVLSLRPERLVPWVVAGLLVFAGRAAWLRGPLPEAVSMRDAATWIAPRLAAGDTLFFADAHSFVTIQHHLRSSRGALLMTEPRLPYYLGRALIPEAKQVPLEAARDVARQGGAWWGVYLRERGRATSRAAAVFDSLAGGESRRFGLVQVWRGGRAP